MLPTSEHTNQRIAALPDLRRASSNKVRYYATSELAWRVGGRITVLILHDGEACDTTIVSGDLLAGGYQGTLHVQGDVDETQASELDLAKWADCFLEPVSQPVAIRLIWGLFAFSMRHHTLELEDFPDGPALGLLPPPRGKAFDWQCSLLKSLDKQCVGIAKEACEQVDLELPPAEREPWPTATIATYPKVPSSLLAALEGLPDEFVPDLKPDANFYDAVFRWKDPAIDAFVPTGLYFSKGQLVTMASDGLSAMAIAMRLHALAPTLSSKPVVRWLPHDAIYARQTEHADVVRGLPGGELLH